MNIQTEPISFSETVPITNPKAQIPIPLCKNSEKATQICQNPQCQSHIFVCSNQECQCQAQHQFCLKVNLKALLKVVSKKRSTTDNQIQKYVQKITDKMIDQISRVRDQVLLKLQYLGLNEVQMNFLAAMQKQQYQKLDSKMLHEICSNIHKKELFSLQHSVDYIEYWWKKEQKKFEDLLRNIDKTVAKSLNHMPVIKGFDSKIVSADEFRDLIAFFDEKITNCNLLYRGSECSFSVTEFRNKCEKKKNNLCIVRTQAGNIIGAYTPISWDTSLASQYVNDPSLKTFIFSLTMKVKFALKNGGNQATHHYTNWGPRFGTDGSCDFAIGENANNTNSNCYANICNLFVPSDLDQEKNLDWIKQNFVGGGVKGTSKFRITQWQMFQLQFN